MKPTKTTVKRIFLYALPGIISALLLLGLYIIKEISPFGNESMVYSDFAQTTAATYYHLHDVVWGGKGFLFDFSVGLGANDYAFMAFNGLFSPITWLVLLVPREYILEFIPYLFVIKVGLMATTFNIFLNKFFTKKPDMLTSTALSVLYALSGYTMMYLVVFQFMDVAIFFPLILLGLKKLYDGKGFAPYAVTLALSTIACYYTSVMILIFILLSSPFIIKMFVLKENRKKTVADLAYGTIFGLMMSAFVLIPTYLQISKSIRLDMFKFENVLKTEADTVMESKLAVLLPLSILICVALSVIVRLITKKVQKEEKKFYLFGLIALVITLLPVFLEPINLMWHTGKYVMFPYRYGFITVAVILAICGYYFGRINENTERRFKKFKPVTFTREQQLILMALAIIISSMLLFLAIQLVKKYDHEITASPSFYYIKPEEFKLLLKISLAFVASIVPLMFGLKDKAVRLVLVCVLCTEAFAFSYLNLGFPQKIIGNESSDAYISISSDFEYTVDFDGGELSKVRDKSGTLNNNYPLVMNRSSISRWVHFISKDNQMTLKSLGYSKTYTRTLDSGGTVFSDALLGVTNVISNTSEPTGFYKRKDSSNGLGLYTSQYTLPFGVKLTNEVANRNNYDISGEKSPFKMQNDIYRDITGKDEDIVKIYDAEPECKNVSLEKRTDRLVVRPDYSGAYNYSIDYTVDVKDRQLLYLNLSDCFGGSKLLKVEVNGTTFMPKSLAKTLNQYYPDTWDNGIIELGVFENETVNISLIPTNKHNYFYLRTVEIGGISEADMKQLSADLYREDSYTVSGSRLKYTVDGKSGEMIFLPISYYDGFSAKINGKKVDVQKVYGNFIGIKLVDGENNITLSFVPSGFVISVIISVLGLLLLILCLHFKRIYGILYICGLKKALYIVYWTVASAALTALYMVLPLMWLIYHIINVW